MSQDPPSEQTLREASSSSSSPNEDDVYFSTEKPMETATWVRHLPEAFGIRKAAERSKYRWCWRESAMWGIATGTAMSLHRMRMRSTSTIAVSAGFMSFFMVYLGSYYFCVKRRDHQERMVRLVGCMRLLIQLISLTLGIDSCLTTSPQPTDCSHDETK